MPRKSKEKIELDINLTNQETEKKVTTKSPKAPASKKTETKKETTKKSASKNTVAEKKSAKKSTSKDTTVKKELTKKATSSENVAKKRTTKKASSNEKAKNKKKSTPKASTLKTKRTKRTKKAVEIIEYYDLPYRYNQTVIRLLAQTPKSLFVYWDISDEDRKNLISKYGENFFEITKPVLLVHNETMNYTFEIEINDFANSWYLSVNDADCVYKIELGRKYINNYQNNIYINNNSDYIYITSSNDLVSPNDHILFNNLNTVYFKNVKTNARTEKKISDIATIKNIGKIYNIYDLYKKIYSEENIDNFDLKNPSSGLSSSSFKI